jgi:hypothetical protein
MADAVYPTARKKLLDGDIDMLSDTIKAALLDTGTVAYNAAHEFYSSVSAGVVGTPVALDGKTTTGGVFDADNAEFVSVSGATVEAVVLFKDTGDPATSPLIVFKDQGFAQTTPNGANIRVIWSNDTNRIFAILG